MPHTGRRLWGEDASNEAERFRPTNTALKAVKEGSGLEEGLAFLFVLTNQSKGEYIESSNALNVVGDLFSFCPA